MKTSVIILTKNSCATVETTVASLTSYRTQGFIQEVIAVDGHSTDGTQDILARYGVRLLLEDAETPFPASARDIGWRHASGELIVYLDSDGYLGDGFFPRVYEFFKDPSIGLVGCEEKTVVTNGLTLANAQERALSYLASRPTSSVVSRIFRWLAGMPDGVSIGGACHAVRRSCLEAAGGFPLVDHGEDLGLAVRVVAAGFRTAWWVGAPVFHQLPSTLFGLLKQAYRHGRQRAVWEIRVEHEKRLHLLTSPQSLCSTLARLASPLVGVALALYLRNPRHLYLYPLVRYAWLTGYANALLNPD